MNCPASNGNYGSGARPPDGRRFSPSVERNWRPIVDVLRRIVPEDAIVLEIASGTGEHARSPQESACHVPLLRLVV